MSGHSDRHSDMSPDTVLLQLATSLWSWPEGWASLPGQGWTSAAVMKSHAGSGSPGALLQLWGPEGQVSRALLPP